MRLDSPVFFFFQVHIPPLHVPCKLHAPLGPRSTRYLAIATRVSSNANWSSYRDLVFCFISMSNPDGLGSDGLSMSKTP